MNSPTKQLLSRNVKILDIDDTSVSYSMNMNFRVALSPRQLHEQGASLLADLPVSTLDSNGFIVNCRASEVTPELTVTAKNIKPKKKKSALGKLWHQMIDKSSTVRTREPLCPNREYVVTKGVIFSA